MRELQSLGQKKQQHEHYERVNGGVRAQIMREIEVQQIVNQKHIIVKEQRHEHIQQVQHQHHHEEIRIGHTKQHEHYEHVSGDVRVRIMREIEAQRIVRQRHIVVHEQHHEIILRIDERHHHDQIRIGHTKQHEHYEHVSGDVRVTMTIYDDLV
jgi:hypothetical protein